MNKLTKDGPRWYSSFFLFFFLPPSPLHRDIWNGGGSFVSLGIIVEVSLQFFVTLFTPRLQSHGRFVGWCGRDRGRTPPRLAQTRRRSPRVGPAWGRTDSLIRHAPGPDWSRNCSTGAWDCQTRRLGRSWNGSPRWYDAPAVTSFERQRRTTVIVDLIYSCFKLFKHHKIIPYLDLPLPGNDFLSKIGEGSVDVLDSGPWYRKSESKRETQRFFPGENRRWKGVSSIRPPSSFLPPIPFQRRQQTSVKYSITYLVHSK